MNQITREYDELARIIEARENEIAELRKELSRYRVPCEECGGRGKRERDYSQDPFHCCYCKRLIEAHEDLTVGYEWTDDETEQSICCECIKSGLACPACLGKGYTEIVRVPDWFVGLFHEFFVPYRNRFTLKEDTDDPDSWLLTEAKE